MTLSRLLAQERRARLAAEKLLAQKQKELIAANQRLGRHTRELTEEVNATRARVTTVESENARVVSELGEAVQKVEAAEGQLWQALEAIRDGFALFSRDGRLQIANPAYLSIFDGLTDVRTGMHYRELITLVAEEGLVDLGGASVAKWVADMETLWTEPKAKPRTLRLWHGKFIKLQNRPTGDDGLVSLAADITELMRMWSAIEELPDGFVLYDAVDRLVMCNHRYRQFYAKSAPVMVPGATFEEILRYGLEQGQYRDAVGQ